jgi:enoyl-CoA hydratase/carnithine racemase
MTNAEATETVEVIRRPPILDIRLNRPAARNALTRAMEAFINGVLDEAEADPDIRAVTLRGNGPVFSAGHDLNEATADMTNPDVPPSRTKGLPRAWYFRKPLLAGVHGYVGPAANELIAPCDFVIAAKRTRFSFEQTRMGSETSGGTILNFQLPMRVIKKLWLMGGWFDADKALQMDYVQRVVPAEKLDEETDRWAIDAGKTPPEHYAAAKEAIHRSYEIRGLSGIVLIGNKSSSRGLTQDQEFYDIVDREGLKAALQWRRRQFEPELGQI